MRNQSLKRSAPLKEDFLTMEKWERKAGRLRMGCGESLGVRDKFFQKKEPQQT